MEHVLIIGYGEIGKSIHKLYEGQQKADYTIITRDRTNLIEVDGITYWGQSATDIMKAYPIDTMHICYTWNEEFVESATKYIRTYEPELVIIHSTLPIGTTQEVYDAVDKICDIVHSPVIGKHPNLTESLRTFRKMIGPISEEAGARAVEHLSVLGVTCEVYDSPRETELAKLFSTTYYGWNITFMKDVWKECKMLDVNFEQVYKTTNEIYNEGYAKFGDTQFIRPVLKYMGSGIGGHCVWQNASILRRDGILPEQAEKVFREGKPDKHDDANI